ncbi:pth11-like integral membrane protein [Grosmannia clavigera kw1407]|uniref:Pth11-like integral membrane protein n=1 Tax=Grosmannia clavigera (strain kw1407 / UAMH 11150) TaxID=655863 RepID=F0XI34_GROCL|nr:pth11-like integral membrane protein [Grosmannia clavigera kw1407]EFX03017.1 pth11-like integral membrane protein [Grosmannia clavigera kw1407]
MVLYSSPPSLHLFSEDKPTLLVCWWITFFCCTVIVLRIAGRYIRSERLFVEDRFVAYAIIPLFLRMGCVHIILKYGTNNADFSGVTLSETHLRQKRIASGLVIASRIFHAATLWILKITILEFFKRINDAISERFSHVSVIIIRVSLVTTFIAVVISSLAECHPFSHYWQVLPDPGGQCRQAYAQLITASACNIFTDLLLVFFPIPIIMFSHQALKRRLQLALLFSMSLGVVGVTFYRVVGVLDTHGSQQLRSLLASVELLFATTAANALVLGSFVRDRGVKKNKFRGGSLVDSMDRPSIARSRRPTVNRHWGSDEDLVRGLGLGVHPTLRNSPEMPQGDDVIFSNTSVRNSRPTPTVRADDEQEDDSQQTSSNNRGSSETGIADLHSWQFPERKTSGGTRTQSAQSAHSGQSEDDNLLKDPLGTSPRANPTSAARKVSFYDVGGLLSSDTAADDNTAQPSLTRTRSGSISGSLSTSQSVPPSPAYTAGSHGFRRGSSALLQDLGGLLSSHPRQIPGGRIPAELHPVPQESPLESPSPATPLPLLTSSPIPVSSHGNFDDIVLMDPGGLLSQSTKR